jgi:hypothetical protein
MEGEMSFWDWIALICGGGAAVWLLKTVGGVAAASWPAVKGNLKQVPPIVPLALLVATGALVIPRALPQESESVQHIAVDSLPPLVIEGPVTLTFSGPLHIVADNAPAPTPTPTPTPTPAPVVPTPVADLQALVTPIGPLVTVPADRQALCAFYVALADTLEKDTTITTTAQLRQVHFNAETLFNQQTGILDKYVGLRAAREQAMTTWMGGKPDTALTSDLRGKAVQFFRALAWVWSK